MKYLNIILCAIFLILGCDSQKNTLIYSDCIESYKDNPYVSITKIEEICNNIAISCIKKYENKESCDKNFFLRKKKRIIEKGIEKVTEVRNNEIQNLFEQTLVLKENEISLQAWKANFSSEIENNKEFNLWAKLDDYYNYNLRHKNEEYLSISLIDDNHDRIHGYIEKNSESGKFLFQYLKNGCLFNTNIFTKKMCPVHIVLGYCKSWINNKCVDDTGASSLAYLFGWRFSDQNINFDQISLQSMQNATNLSFNDFLKNKQKINEEYTSGILPFQNELTQINLSLGN